MCENEPMFKIEVDKKDNDICKYTYCHMNHPNEEYIWVLVREGTFWLNSLVTFKPAGIPDAPVMVVDTTRNLSKINREDRILIYLPRSVGKWEIKYYSNLIGPPSLTHKYLKCAGVVNLKQFFGKYISDGLDLELTLGQRIVPHYCNDNLSSSLEYVIPNVNAIPPDTLSI